MGALFTVPFTLGVGGGAPAGGCTVTTTGVLCWPVPIDRTWTTFVPLFTTGGICATIWPAAVFSSGKATSLNVTHEPPRTVGVGSTLAVAVLARFVPFTLMKPPTRSVADPSDAFTMPFFAAICGIGAP